MKKDTRKDTRNEYIGIISIIIIIIVALLSVYYFSRQRDTGTKELVNSALSLETSSQHVEQPE
jgi:hypothetical protein